ncbi:MAG: VOC family protein [Aeromicrobium sp.]
MSTRLNPYIAFDGNAREAMEFYQAVFGGELDVSTWGEMPDMPGNSPEMHDKLMHSMLTVDDSIAIMAADMPESNGPKGSPISVSLSGEDEARLRGWWEGISEGAEINAPFEKAPWGDTYGECIDRFGVRWMVNVAGGQQ